MSSSKRMNSLAHRRGQHRKQKVRRRQGRPASADAIGRQRLVDAARKVLRTLPPAKLTSAQIATAAGADRGLVRYYFGTMPELLAEVARQLSRDLVISLAQASAGPGTAATRLRRRIREFVRYELDNPALHPLYTEQILSGKARSAAETIKFTAARGHDSFRELIEFGRRNGEFRNDFDLRLLDIAIVGLCEFIVVGRPILEAWLGEEEDVADLLALYGDFVADLVIDGISRKQQAARGADARNKRRRN